MFRSFLNAVNRALGNQGNEDDDDDDDDESDNPYNLQSGSSINQPTRPILGTRFQQLNSSDEIDESNETPNQSLGYLGSHFMILRDNANNSNDIESHEVSSLKNDIDLIGRKIFELNDKLNTISVEQIQHRSISIGNYSSTLEHESQSIQDEQTDLLITKQEIGNHLKFLNEKLNSLQSNDIDNHLVPILSSNINQLENALKRIESTIIGHEIHKPTLGSHVQQLNTRLILYQRIDESSYDVDSDISTNTKISETRSSMENTTENDYFDSQINLQLASYSELLEKKITGLKNIFYKRYKAKYEELFEKLKLKYETDFEEYKRKNNVKSQLEEYANYCVKSNKSEDQLRILFRGKFENDLEFKHYFHLFLLKYKENLFKLVLNESYLYIPRSKQFDDCYLNDKKYILFEDLEQLKLIYEFLTNVIDLYDIKQFENLVQRKIVTLDLFMKNMKNLRGKHEQDYLALLKESYFVFVRDYILTLYDDNLVSNDQIVEMFYRIKLFIEKNLKTINDLERSNKLLFIRQFKEKYDFEKLLNVKKDYKDCKLEQLTTKKDTQVEELKLKWLNTNNLNDYAKYEDYVINMKDSIAKSEHLFEIGKIYIDKQPSLKLYLKKSIDLLNNSIAIDQFRIDSSNMDLDQMSILRIKLRNRYELRALIHLRMAEKYNFSCFDKSNHLNKSKYDFVQFHKLTNNEENIKYHEKNVIHLFKKAFDLNDKLSINLYDSILQINPYFFEAQYQKLLKLYELNESQKVCHLNKSFSRLPNAAKPMLDFFEILINKKKKKKKKTSQNNKTTDLIHKTSQKSKSTDFINRIIQVKVRNNQNKPLYLKFSKNEDSCLLKCNNEDQLINLLKYGKLNIEIVKNDVLKSHQLKYVILNSDFKRILINLNEKIRSQESNFLTLINSYKKLELTNEFEYKNLDKSFLQLLPETRFNLIKLNSNYFQSICEISRSIKEFKKFLTNKRSCDNEIKQKIIQLQLERANIYRDHGYFYLEELEFLNILNNQKTSSDYNPMIYYRLSCLCKSRFDLQESIKYINLASKKYNEKINKKIFKKANKLKFQLLELENAINDDTISKQIENLHLQISNNDNNEQISKLQEELYQLEHSKYIKYGFIGKNRMNLLHIFNLIYNMKLNSIVSITNGFELYHEPLLNDDADGLINCLFYHLIDDIQSLEEYLNKNNNLLTKFYNELKEKYAYNSYQTTIILENLIKKFDERLRIKFKCFFIENVKDWKDFELKKDEIPIILSKHPESNKYVTTKVLNHGIPLISLLATYNARKDLKVICSKFLTEEISKNILIDNNENKNIEIFINSMVECEKLKEFVEQIVFYLKTDNYEENCFHFWSLVADLEYNIDMQETLYHFKELFKECIEEHRQEQEEQHKSSLDLIDEQIEQNQNEQKYFDLLNKLKEEIINSLSIYENVSPRFEKRKQISTIISSNYNITDKIKKLISFDCLNIDLKFKDVDEEERFFQHLKTDDKNDIPYTLLSIIEDTFSKPKISKSDTIITIEGYNIFLSTLINDLENTLQKPESTIQELRLYGTNIFIDTSLDKNVWHGINIIAASDIIDVVEDASNNKIIVDVSGRKGSDGKNGEHRPHATRESEDGLDGLPGGNGESGQNGGNIYLIAEKKFNGRNNIEKLITSGGDGGIGGNGGNGGNGHDGEDGKNAGEENYVGFFYYGYLIERGEDGTRGGDGGVGGDAGLGGLGGHAGIVYIEENQGDITSFFSNKIESKDKSNVNAQDGLPGEGGKGGLGGSDGNDVLYHKPNGFSKNKVYRGHIKINGVQDTFFKFYLDFEYEKRPKKRNGIDNVQGKSANAQLINGKTRHKSSKKEKLNEQQIKQQLNETINNNNEESQVISNNITKSIDLLNAQMNDILDERATKVKTHELSNSMLENAHRIAQQSLALNAIKVKSKIESTILKTADTHEQKIDKSIIRSKLDFDKHEKQSIQFEKNNSILQDLMKSYNDKIKELRTELSNHIEKVKGEIKSLKSQGRNILFQIDIENLNNRLIIGKNTANELDSQSSDVKELNMNDEILLNDNLSSLTNEYKSVLYNPNNKNYEPFLLSQYFERLNSLKKQKQSFIKIRNKINKLNIDKFINELCLEYGNKESIKEKLLKLDEIIDFNQLETNTQFDSFDFNDFIKQNDLFIDASNEYEVYIEKFLQNPIEDSILIKEISNTLIMSKIPLKRIQKSKNFINLLIQALKDKKNFKQLNLMESSPIYHDQNEPFELHLIEELIYQFIESKEKSLELLVRILKCFISILEHDEQKFLCKKKVENFIQFLVINLINIKIDFEYGYLLNIMKKRLNYIQVNYSSLNFIQFFDHLELIILIKEKQFDNTNYYITKIHNFFQDKQNDIDFQIKIINFIKNNTKNYIFNLFHKHVKVDETFDNNKNVHEFIDNFYLDKQIKDEFQIMLHDFFYYLKNIQLHNYNDLINSVKLFLGKLKLFLHDRKMEKKTNSHDLLLKKDKCENLVYLLYKNMNLSTNIEFLNDIDTFKDKNVDDFIQKFKDLYEKLRIKEIYEMNKGKNPILKSKIDVQEMDYNKKVCEIFLITRHFNHFNKIQITNGYKIFIFKEKISSMNQFTIYYRDQKNYEVQSHLLNEQNLIEILNNLNFNDETKLDKKNDNQLYKLIYREIESKNGFTKYSLEQIESFERFKILVIEKLILLKESLTTNVYEYVTKEINDMFNENIPDVWAFKISLILNSIKSTLKIKDKFQMDFNLSTTENLLELKLTKSNVFNLINDYIEHLFQDDILITFYKCLVALDFLLIQIMENTFETSIEVQMIEISQKLLTKTQQNEDLKVTLLYELVIKHNRILKEFYFNETLNKFDQQKHKILDWINSSPSDLNIKQESKQRVDLFFNASIYHGCIKLFNFIDDLYSQTLNHTNIFNKFEIYSRLMIIVKDFSIETLLNSKDQSNEILDQLMETFIAFLDYLQKYSLIFISEIMNVADQDNKNAIEKLLHDLKRNYQCFELFSLRILPSNNSEQTENFKNEILFDEKIFIEIFIKRILTQRKYISKEQLKKYFNSYRIILKNSIINPDILILFDQSYQNLIKEENDQEMIEIFDQFDILIREKYQDLIQKMKLDFNLIMSNVKHKNRILNIVFKYLSKQSKENNDNKCIGFEKDELINTMLQIKNILETNELNLRDVLHCFRELNKGEVTTPSYDLKTCKNQLNLLKIRTRQFIENLNFSKDSELKNEFYGFNNCLDQGKSIDNELIVNLLTNVLKNRKTFDSDESYTSTMDKILFNLRIISNNFNMDLLEKVEEQIKTYEKIRAIKKNYLLFIIEIVKSQLTSKYKEKLKEYETINKTLYDLIKEILDLFWSNVSMSDLLNKEREKTYLNINIEKLLIISNVDHEQQKSILNKILNKLKELQSNPNKKQFTNEIHNYLNHQINQALTRWSQTQDLIIPERVKKALKDSTEHILENKYDHVESEIILKEFSLLFEISIDRFKNKDDFNMFFESLKNIFTYFSWRLIEYESNSKQDIINQSLERFNASIKTFKRKVIELKIENPMEKFNQFYEFEKIFNLRTHENQSQQELNSLQDINQQKLNIIDQIVNLWMKMLDNCCVQNNEKITSLGNEFLIKVNEIITKNKRYLNNFYSNLLTSPLTNEKEDEDSLEELNTIEEQIETEPEQQELISKLDLQTKFSLLNQMSMDLINQEKTWETKKTLIKNFDAMKENLFEYYFKSKCSNQSIDYETMKNSIPMKNLKEIITHSDSIEWNQEINSLSKDLFIKNLLSLYGFNFDILKQQYELIDEKLSEKKPEDNNENNSEDILNRVWQNEVKQDKNLIEVIDYIIQYSKEMDDKYELKTSLDGLTNTFIRDIKLIQNVKQSIDTLYFFAGHENFTHLINVLKVKIIDSKCMDIQLNKLVDLFYLLSNLDNFNKAIELLNNFNVDRWLLQLNLMQIKSDLKLIFDRYLDDFDLNSLVIENTNNLEEFVEKRFNEIRIQYDRSYKEISTTIRTIKSDNLVNFEEKELVFEFLRVKLSFELRKDSNRMINPNELNKLFNKFLIVPNIMNKIINSLNRTSSDTNNNNDMDQRSVNMDCLIIDNIRLQSLTNLLPYLTRFWIIEYLELNKKVLNDEATKILQYFELIKASYSEEKMFQLIDVIKDLCSHEEVIPHSVIDLLMNISNNEWILNNEMFDIIKNTKMTLWEKTIENYMKQKRLKNRDLKELINLMKEDKNNLNQSIQDYLNSETIFEDFKILNKKLNESIDKNISKKPVRDWEERHIKKWALKVKGNKLLSNKEQVQNAIVVVSRAIYLFTYKKSKDKKIGFYPRETQTLALWLFLNPDLNKRNLGCLAQISTGEGKSIIVAALATIKALSYHRVDIITSSNVLAIRDAAEFKPLFDMFDLQVSNNCDALCEQGDGNQSAEDIRKLRYFNENGPVDIIYGECSCFERDILLTEFNQTDENQNIISKRHTNNSISSVIIDEVDSMLLDKANMVLYLSHNIDTLKSLERIFVSIWQTINQSTFDQISRTIGNDDLIELVSNIILEQIDNKTIDIPEYDSKNCDYINMKSFIKRRMPIWIKSAFHVKDMVPNDTYIISQDKYDKSSKSEVKITVMDKDTGTEQLSTRWSNGVHQFLQLKHTRRLTSESLKAVFISNMSFFKRYQNNIAGLTGSLGSIDEQSLLDKVYKLRFFELPRFKQELFRELKSSVYAEQENWLEGIKNALDREIKLKSINNDKRRAILIICENVKSVLILHEYLSNSYPNAKVYKSAYEKFEIDKLNPGDIIIATNLAGRGTDLDTSEKLEDNGGLHVITTYLPTNIRIEMQAFGRTARKGNKGTGEYILLSRYGLSIEQLKQIRNIQEKERLESFLLNELPKIKIEEDLLQGFTDDQSKLSCIGFTQLYQRIEAKLSNDFNSYIHGYQYIQYQLNSLKNRWAFWLDSMTEYINMINIIGKKTIIEKFNEFQSTIERDVAANNFKKLIIEPTELIKLGKYYRDNENWSKALICYKEASSDKFYSFVNYYTSSCRQNINYANGIQSKRDLKHSLYDVKLSIDKEMQFLNNAAQLAFEIGERNRKLGFAGYGNEYDRQVKEKSSIWSIFSSTITSTVGCSISAKDLMGNKYLCDEEKAEKLFKQLRKEKLIKPSRITKKLKEQIELPSIFNNERTKKQLMEYLIPKSKQRQNDSGKFNELNSETFKNDLKAKELFFPYLNQFIDLLETKGFIKEIHRSSDDQLFLFQNFNEEKFSNAKLPKDITKLKENLFDCAKEISGDKGFKGKKDEILNELETLFMSKTETAINKDQLNSFYTFLNKNSCFEKLNEYSVLKNRIIRTNEELKDNYQYSNLYDFERHYTDEFKNFELIFRRNFLKIILIQEDFENGDSYFTLKDAIDSNEFELPKTEEEAIDYLWNFLVSNTIIKPPKVNVGLISLKEVQEQQKKITKEIRKYFQNELSYEDQQQLDEAVNSVFNIIDQTIGELKKLPDNKTIASYLEIKKTYFLDNKKASPDALDEFIELALDVVFRLEEKKQPPEWYEIAAVVALGVIQVIAGVLAKTFIPVVGQLIGEFLISTGCDDILFGVQCAISGDFSWEKYWQHKKQSMLTSAITAVVFVGAAYLKNAKRLKSFQKAWDFQKLTGANKLHTAASKLKKTANIGKYIGKEIAKTLAQTGLSEIASLGIDHMLDTISNTYEMELATSIKKSVSEKWTKVEIEMKEIYRLSECNDLSQRIIEDCITRRLQNLPEATALKSFTSVFSPVMQGLGKAIADGQGRKGTIQRLFTSYAPSIINLGVNIAEVAIMIDGFMKNLANDLKDAKKKLSKTNKHYVLTESQKDDFERFQENKRDQIANHLSETMNQKLKNGILAPVLKFATNKLISKGIESLAGADRIEQLANRFELIHAATNPEDTKTKYADDLQIFLAEARPINLQDFNVDPNNIHPANVGDSSLQQIYDLYGDKVKTYIDKNGRIYVRRPSSKEYYRSVKGDKPAGIHEQRKVAEVLQCTITKEEMINNEQKCILQNANGSQVSFVIKDNLDGTKHAELIVEGKSITLDTSSLNKNDCFYNVALVANEMSQGKSYEEAVKILEDKNSVQNLRNSVSLAMKHDEKLLNEFRWTNRTDLKSHFSSLTGFYVDNQGDLRLNDDDIKFFRTSFANAAAPSKPQEMKRKGKDSQGNDVELTDHHLISKAEISKQLNDLVSTVTDDNQLKNIMETYLNDPNNATMKAYIMKGTLRLNRSKNQTADFQAQGHDALRLKSVLWNPNNLVPGPPESHRLNRYGSAYDEELLKGDNLRIYENSKLNILEKLAGFKPDSTEPAIWTKQQNKFTYTPGATGADTYSYPRFL